MAGVDDIRVEPARLWRRVLSFVVDLLLIGGLVAALLTLAASLSGIKPSAQQLPGVDGFITRMHALEKVWIPGAALGALLALAYCAVGAILFRGRTLGRALLGIRLVDSRGGSPAPGRAVARAVLAVPSVAVCFAGFWWALFDRRGQTLHDKLTATFVVRP